MHEEDDEAEELPQSDDGQGQPHDMVLRLVQHSSPVPPIKATRPVQMRYGCFRRGDESEKAVRRQSAVRLERVTTRLRVRSWMALRDWAAVEAVGRSWRAGIVTVEMEYERPCEEN